MGSHSVTCHPAVAEADPWEGSGGDRPPPRRLLAKKIETPGR